MSIGCIPFLVVNYPQFGLVSEKKRMISMSDQKSRGNFMKSQSPSLLLKSHEMMKSPLHGSKNRNLQGPSLVQRKAANSFRLQEPFTSTFSEGSSQAAATRPPRLPSSNRVKGRSPLSNLGSQVSQVSQPKKKMSQDSLDKVVAKNIQKLYSIRCEYYWILPSYLKKNRNCRNVLDSHNEEKCSRKFNFSDGYSMV